MVNRTLFLAALIAIIVPVALYMSTQGQAVQQQQQELSSIQVYRVDTGDVRTSVEASGEVEPENEVALSFEASGTLRLTETIAQRHSSGSQPHAQLTEAL